MGKRQKPKVNTRDLSVELARKVRTHWERKDYAQAYQSAQQLAQREPTPERFAMLNRARVLYADELADQGNESRARELIGHFPENNAAADSTIAPVLGRLLSRLGMIGDALANPKWSRTFVGLEAHLVDGLVLQRLKGINAATPSAESELKSFGAAFEALDADDERVRAALQEIPRQSPFAEWRLFFRGLLAYNRRADSETIASWDRLAPDRVPKQLAEVLLRTLPQKRSAAATPHAIGRPTPVKMLAALEQTAFGEIGLLGDLETLRNASAEGNFDAVKKVIATLAPRLKKAGSPLYAKLSAAVYEYLLFKIPKLMREASEETPEEKATRVILAHLQPPAIDPHFDRFWAIAFERADFFADATSRHWRKYVDTLAHVKIWDAAERRLAGAIVCQHAAMNYLEEIEQDQNSPFPAPKRKGVSPKKSAEAWLLEAAELDPSYLPARRTLWQAYLDWKQPRKAVGVLQAVAEQFPNDVAALSDLAAAALSVDQPTPAIQALDALRRLKPLDPHAIALLELARFVAVRHSAKAERFDEAKQVLASILEARPELVGNPAIKTHQAIIEFLAGDANALERFRKEIAADPADSATGVFTLAILSTLYDLNAKLAADFFKTWQSDAKQGSFSALALRRIISFAANNVLRTNLPIVVKRKFLKPLFDYIKRTAAPPYDLQTWKIAVTLPAISDDSSLREKLIAHGLASFPDEPAVMFEAGQREMERGPFRCDRKKARLYVQKALDVLTGANAQQDPPLLEKVRNLSTFLEEVAPPGQEGFAFEQYRDAIEELIRGGFGIPDLAGELERGKKKK